MQRNWGKQMRMKLFFLVWTLCLSGIAAGAGELRSEDWTTSWSAAQQAVCDAQQLPKTNLDVATLRQSVHLSVGGKQLRMHISNQYGKQPLRLGEVSIALSEQATSKNVSESESTYLSFQGSRAASVEPGQEIVSDPVRLRIRALSTLAVTMKILSAPKCVTSHPGARATSYLATSDTVDDASLLQGERVEHWYFISAVDVADGKTRGAVVAFGDSITDGHGATTDGNDRWTDILAARLTRHKIAVLNAGIGGNRILADGLGPSGISRFERDALGEAGVKTVILLEGVNDLGGLDRIREHPQAAHDFLVDQLQNAMRGMVEKAHRKGVCVLGGTIMPYAGSGYYHPSPVSEADRVRLNLWIRTSGIFDGVIDFDQLLRDSQHPDHLSLRSGTDDLLHPGPSGYKLMGEAIPESMLTGKACRTLPSTPEMNP